MQQLLHSPDFWIGFAAAYVLLALLVVVLAIAYVPELRNVRWPALPSTLTARAQVAPTSWSAPIRHPIFSNARQGRSDRAAGRIWPHDDYAANEEGELGPALRLSEVSALPWDVARHQGGDL
jgi:hypothetical protein